jgi:hypothetical protein
MDDLLDRIRAEIEAHGWQVVLFPAEGDAPAYGHTVGLSTRFDHPELVICGLDEGADGGVMHDVLEAAAELVAGGHRFEPGATNADLLDDHLVAVRPVDPKFAASLLEVAAEVLGTEVRALQLVWPDRRGLMPWSPACDPVVRARQPLLAGK